VKNLEPRGEDEALQPTLDLIGLRRVCRSQKARAGLNFEGGHD
jgi:hypothetical protein